MMPPARARLRKSDWLDLGLESLASEGPDSLTVDRLCTRSGRTRGSFYHHFEDAEAYLDALAHRWAQCSTDELIARTPDSFSTLRDLASRLDPVLELEMRRLAARKPGLQPIVETVDRQRVAHLAALHQRRSPAPGDAGVRAELDYAVYLGWLQLKASKPDLHLETLYRALNSA